MKPNCDRTWQVEAARDERLAADELASFTQHQLHCPHCQRERRAFEALAEELRSVGTHVDEMALRRLRQRTLDRASDAIQRRSRRGPVWAALALACAATAFGVWWNRREPAPTSEVAMLSVEPQQDARWHRAREQDVERVELRDGTLLFRVARKLGDPRLLVRVPDGEIEDVGTVFSVTVANGKTREIRVREGHVVFRRNDASNLHLAAGAKWQASDERAPTLEQAPQLELAPEPSQQNQATLPPKLPKARHASITPHTPAPADAGSGEDAAYLHILALLREGRREEARLAAFAYLQTYPTGFRAPEVSKVAISADEAGSRRQDP